MAAGQHAHRHRHPGAGRHAGLRDPERAGEHRRRRHRGHPRACRRLRVWHVQPSVHAGEYVRAHRTVIGHVIRGAGHLHLSELYGDYVNPLRPGGRVWRPPEPRSR